jgi:hypothetical protein
MWPRSDSLQAVNREWREFRVMARRTAFSPEEFGPSDRVQYDLDTAGITGADNPRTYTVDRPVTEEGDMNNGTDVRTLDRR